MKIIETGIDEIMDYLKEKGSASIGELAEEFDYPKEVVEEWVIALEDHGAVEIDYGLTSTKVSLVEEKTKEEAKKKLKEEKEEKDEHVCNKCGKSFETEHGLITHEKMMHKEED